MRVTNNTTITIYRKCPRTGFRETIEFSGPARSIPKGWRILRA